MAEDNNVSTSNTGRYVGIRRHYDLILYISHIQYVLYFHDYYLSSCNILRTDTSSSNLSPNTLNKQIRQWLDVNFFFDPILLQLQS